MSMPCQLRLVSLPNIVEAKSKLSADFRLRIEFCRRLDDIVFLRQTDDLHEIKYVIEVLSTSRIDSQSHELHGKHVLRGRDVDAQPRPLFIRICGEKLVRLGFLSQWTEISPHAIVQPVRRPAVSFRDRAGRFANEILVGRRYGIDVPARVAKVGYERQSRAAVHGEINDL